MRIIWSLGCCIRSFPVSVPRSSSFHRLFWVEIRRWELNECRCSYSSVQDFMMVLNWNIVSSVKCRAVTQGVFTKGFFNTTITFGFNISSGCFVEDGHYFVCVKMWGLLLDVIGIKNVITNIRTWQLRERNTTQCDFSYVVVDTS